MAEQIFDVLKKAGAEETAKKETTSNFDKDKGNTLFKNLSNTSNVDREKLDTFFKNINNGQYIGSDLQKANYQSQQMAQNQYAQNLQQTQTTALDAIRKANASAIASGANAGLGAANQLSSILGLQQESSANAADIANNLMKTEGENSKWMQEAMLSGVQRGSELTAAEAAKKSADAQYWEQLGIDTNTLLTNIQKGVSSLTPEQAAGDEGKAYAYSRKLLEMAMGAPTLEERQQYQRIMNALQGAPNAETLAQAEALVGTLSADQIKQLLTSFPKAEESVLPTDPSKDTPDQAAQRENNKIAFEKSIEGNNIIAEDENGTIKVNITKDWSTGDTWNYMTSYTDINGNVITRDRVHTDGYKNIKNATIKLPDGTTYTYTGSHNARDVEKEFAKQIQKNYEDTINKYIKNGQYDKAEALAKSINTKTESDGCVTGDTLITLANGKQKPIRELKAGDAVLSFNGTNNVITTLYTPLKHKIAKRKVLRLIFSNEQYVDTVDGHSFYSANAKKCVSIDFKNVKNYIGTEFIIGPGQYATLSRVYGYEINEEVYSPMAHKNIWLYTNGILSAAHLTEFIVNARLKNYNKNKLMTYEQFPIKEVSQEIFDAYDGEMLAIWAKGFNKFTIKQKIKNLIKLLD